MPAERPPTELALSAAWGAGRLRGPLRTVDGRAVEIVHRGLWSRGLGPDFRDALIVFDGRDLRPGSVELHLLTSAWAAHGHADDPRYDDVVLHAVLRHDGAQTRRRDGALVPVLELAPYLTDPLDAPTGPAADWSRFGGESCAPDLARARPAELRAILWRLGDARLAAKAARMEARLTGGPPADALLAELWDGLGYRANRDPMRALAAALPLALVEPALATAPVADRLPLARALLFGAAGFLPLAPADAAFAALTTAEVHTLEAAWARHGAPWRGQELPPTAWTRARVRPANHPAARLAAGAALLAAVSPRGGLVAALLAPLRAGDDPVAALRDLTATPGHPGLGADRAAALAANALLPFALALAEHAADPALADAAARAWERLPAADPNEVTRRAVRQVAGEARLPPLGARGQQGLIHLDQTLCAPRRCHECPVALRVLGEA